jgi:hypothetical protein
MRSRFSPAELAHLTLAPPFAFTKGVSTLRIRGSDSLVSRNLDTMLFDLASDPQQQHPYHDPQVVQRLVASMRRMMAAHDAPAEQYERVGLTQA